MQNKLRLSLGLYHKGIQFKISLSHLWRCKKYLESISDVSLLRFVFQQTGFELVHLLLKLLLRHLSLLQLLLQLDRQGDVNVGRIGVVARLVRTN